MPHSSHPTADSTGGSFGLQLMCFLGLGKTVLEQKHAFPEFSTSQIGSNRGSGTQRTRRKWCGWYLGRYTGDRACWAFIDGHGRDFGLYSQNKGKPLNETKAGAQICFFKKGNCGSLALEGPLKTPRHTLNLQKASEAHKGSEMPRVTQPTPHRARTATQAS